MELMNTAAGDFFPAARQGKIQNLIIVDYERLV